MEMKGVSSIGGGSTYEAIEVVTEETGPVVEAIGVVVEATVVVAGVTGVVKEAEKRSGYMGEPEMAPDQSTWMHRKMRMMWRVGRKGGKLDPQHS